MAKTVKHTEVRLESTFDKKGYDTAKKETAALTNTIDDGFKKIAKRIAAAFSVAMAVKFFKDSAKMAGESELALSKLSSALESTGQNAGKLTPQINAISGALQKLTVYDDEVLNSLAATAINMGIAGDKMEEAQRAAIGLATAFEGAGLDLNTAMKGFALATNGALCNFPGISRN